MITVNAFVGRSNRQRLQLLQDGEPVAPGAITRAVLRFSTYCLDTAVGNDPIALVDDATVVETQIGLLTDLEPVIATGTVTIYDNLAVDGIAWQRVLVNVKPWETC